MPRPALNGTAHLGPLNASYTAGDPEHTAPVLLRMAGQVVACDIETFGLGPDGRRLKAVSFATRDAAVVLDPREPAQAALIRYALGAVRQLWFHNTPFDVPSLYLNGLLDMDGLAKVGDVLLYARLAHPDVTVRKSLESLASRYLGFTSDSSMKAAFRMHRWTITEGYRNMDIDTPGYLMGSAIDAIVTYRLIEPVCTAARGRITDGHPFTTYGLHDPDAVDELVDREQRINRMLLRRTCRGLRIDRGEVDRYRDVNAAELARADAELRAAGVKPGNGNSLMAVLEPLGAIPDTYPRTPKTGRPSTVAGSLEQLYHPLAGLFVRHKQISKVGDDYLTKVNNLARDDAGGWPRIHPTVNLLAATTGRMSVGDPPLQQFPGAARGIVMADPGDRLTSVDWSQIEPVIGANIAGDRALLAGYESGTSDLYTDIAALAGITRKTAKIVVLAQMYGEGLAKLAADLGVTVEIAKEYRRALWEAMPDTTRLLYRLRDIGREHRKIFTLSGRILDIPMGTYQGEVGVQTHKAVNYFIQGSAYDVLAEALVEIDRQGLGDAVYLAMHDELVVSSDAAHDVETIMKAPPERLIYLAQRVPVLRTDSCDLGEHWAEA